MGVSVLITSRKVYGTYANGDDFGLNLGDFATFLRGGVMVNQQAQYDIEIEWASLADKTNNGIEFNIAGNNLNRNIGSWIDEGFSIGDTIDLSQVPAVPIFTDRVITNITDLRIIFDGAAPGNSIEPNAILNGGKTDLFALEYSFGMISNVDPASYKSLLDNSDQTYYADNIGVDGGGGRDVTPVPMQVKSNSIQGWDSSRTDKTTVAFVSRTTYVQTFKIIHEYIINPYNDPALFLGNLSLRYTSKFDFRTNLANLNTSKIQIDDIQLGSVGDFDENYDGYNNDFSVSNLVYTDVATASTVTELNIKSKTRVNFRVTSASGFFTIADPFNIFHSYNPVFNVYNQSPNTFRDTWIYNNLRNEIDAGALSSSVIKDSTATFVDANTTDYQFDIELSAPQQLLLNEGDKYFLAAEVGDGDLSAQANNTVVKIDANTYLKDPNITGLIISDPTVDFGFTFYANFIAPTTALFSSYKGWIEDGIVSFHRFGVNRTDPKDGKILGGRVKLVAYEDATGETFELSEQTQELDLSGQLIAPPGTVSGNPFNIQLITDDRRRGYNLPDGDEFNLLLFETKDSDATYQYYEWRVGVKMNWQTWIALPGADNVFIIPAETFQNKNNRASNYSLKNGWSMRYQWQFDMEGIDDEGIVGETEYSFFTSAFDIRDFGDQDDDPTEWICTGETFGEDDALLSTFDFTPATNAIILTDEFTRYKATFTPTAPFVIASIDPYWAVLRIAEVLQPGFDVDVLSTTKLPLSTNRIIALDGEDFATITLVANTIVVEGRIDFNRLATGVGYKLSAELRGDAVPPAIQEWVFQTDSDIPTDAPFDPSVVTTGGEVVTWNLIGGYAETTNTLSISVRTGLPGTPSTLTAGELDGSTQNVTVTFSTNDPSNITEVSIEDDNIVGNLNVAIFSKVVNWMIDNNPSMTQVTHSASTSLINNYSITNNNITGTLNTTGLVLGVAFLANDNVNLTGITITASSSVFTFFRVNNCDLTGTLVLSMLTGLGGQIRMGVNPNLTGVTIPTSSEDTSQFFINACDLTGNFNFSGMTGDHDDFRVFNNPNLTSITNPSTSFVMEKYWAYDCDLTGTHDMTDISNFVESFDVHGNSSLTDITNPGTSTIITDYIANGCDLGYIDFTVFSGTCDNINIQLDNNDMVTGEVDDILADLNASGWIDGTVNLAGSNDSPTDGTSNADKLALEADGWTVTVTP